MRSRSSVIALTLFLCLSVFNPANANIPEYVFSGFNSSEVPLQGIVIAAPEIAENGAVVPISIKNIVYDKSKYYIKEIVVYSDVSGIPIARFKLGPNALAEGLTTRIKLARSATIYAVAELSDGRLIVGTTHVSITIGGCGGGEYVGPGGYAGGSSATPWSEKYAGIINNGIVLTANEPISTFSIDVDTGSYSNVRRFINADGRLPPKDAVRTEEMVNYFSYKYKVPENVDTPFSVNSELGPSPWRDQSYLLKIGIKGFVVPAESLPASNLVFLVDVSGSMDQPSKLGLLVSSLKMLTQQLSDQDRISIVVYAGASGIVLRAAQGNNTRKVVEALDSLRAGGSTNGASGIKLAYDVARETFIEGGVNRVILATDGDFNVGTVNHSELIDLISKKRETGIGLTTLGFGEGNYNEKLMEQMASKGDGNYAYIDSLNEAYKVLVQQRASTLFTIAKDVKIQVEFNPEKVSEFRLIGYENRLLKKEDFNNDKVDAGDIGAGHTVTALYEISLAGSTHRYVDARRYGGGKKDESFGDELAFIKIRYKDPGDSNSHLLNHVVRQDTLLDRLQDTSDDFCFASAVAAYGQILRQDNQIGDFSLTQAADLARQGLGDDTYGYRHDFITLVNLTQALHVKSN